MRYETFALSSLALSAHVEQGAMHLRLGGRLGVRDVDALEAALSRIVARRPSRVVIDLSDLESVAAVGIGSLNTFRHALTRAGGQVQFQNPCPDVAARLRECGLGSAF
jgi:anti-anti-sigma factor